MDHGSRDDLRGLKRAWKHSRWKKRSFQARPTSLLM
ncbi:unnamed protein product [Linum tenue]|uniref:Uncharacterized protein n=1 Tax=Linum tenue TaxID=586396 RepID=A0AAV0KWB7_9ROSI|nr:unnamed protein product [Linum tenue]